MSSTISIRDREFRELRNRIHELFGIDLGEDKKELVAGRLQPVLQARRCKDFQNYLDLLNESPSPELTSELIDRISTNHTFFYREPAHFDFFRQRVLPELIKQHSAGGEKDLRVWCAASSSGEEPYTLMMLIFDALGSHYGEWHAGLLATDLSSRALSAAKAGVYPAENVARLPPTLRATYFESQADQNVCVVERIKKEIVFRRFNLIQQRYSWKRPFQVIFCRNVMIYFNAKTRREVVDRLYEVTAEGGYLFVGHSESLERSSCPYDFVAPGIYQRNRR